MSAPEVAPVRSWENARGVVVLLGGLTIVSLGVLLGTDIPLGVPGEWTWARRSLTEIDPVALVGSGLLGAVYWGLARWGEKRVIRRERMSPGAGLTRWTLAGVCLLALGWLFLLLSCQPDFQGLARSPTVLYYKRTEGYFWQAAFDVQDTRQFLSQYQHSISEGDDPDRYLHLGTHPPGLTLAYRGLLAVWEGSPSLTRGLIALEPPPIQAAMEALREFPTPLGPPLSPPQEAALWGATLATLLLTAAACWPIARLASRMGGAVTGWRAAVLWPLVPSLLVFFPKSDLLVPWFATMGCWLWLDGWSRGRWGRCVLAGGVFFGGLMLTLALAPVALLLVVQTSMERWTRRAEWPDRRVTTDLGLVAAATAGLVIPGVVFSLWGNCSVVGIAIENLRNHAMFYSHNVRSYGLWLAVNPVEGALALGMPIATCVVVGMMRGLRDRPRSAIAISQNLAWLVVWGILWLSGKNMGEAARLWIFLAPWPVILAASAMRSGHSGQAATSPAGEDSVLWRVVFPLQILAAIGTMGGVDGFHFAELIPAQ